MADPFITNLNYVEKVPSLRKLSSTRLVLQLWKTVDISPVMRDRSWMYYSRYVDPSDTDHFKTLVNSIMARIGTLLPNSFIDKVEYLTRYVGLHLCEWLSYMNNLNFGLDIHDILACTNWTVYGTVDEYASVESLVRKFRYRIADAPFYFCKENEALKMLDEDLPSGIQEYCNNCGVDSLSDILMKYWLFKDQERLSEFSVLMRNSSVVATIPRVYIDESDFWTININRLMTKVSVVERNSLAVEYFFSTLEEEEKAENIEGFFDLTTETEYFMRDESPKSFQIAYFFYLHMEPNLKKATLSNYKFYILHSMIEHFGFQNQIVQTISLLWDILHSDHYCQVLLSIGERLYEERFVNFLLINNIWHVTPESIKRKFFAYITCDTTCILLVENSSQLKTGGIMQDATIRKRNEIYSFCEI